MRGAALLAALAALALSGPAKADPCAKYEDPLVVTPASPTGAAGARRQADAGRRRARNGAGQARAVWPGGMEFTITPR